MKNTLRNYLFVLIPIETIVSILMQRTDDEGFVYILSNPAYKNNFVKIGKTSVSPRSRASELSTTGVPTPFSVEYYCKAKDYHRLEKRVHQYLQKERVSPKKEFFEITIDRAIFAIQELGKNDILHEEIAAEKRKEMEELVRQRRKEIDEYQRKKALENKRHEEINEFTKTLKRDLYQIRNERIGPILAQKEPDTILFWIKLIGLFAVPITLTFLLPISGFIIFVLTVGAWWWYMDLAGKRDRAFDNKINPIKEKVENNIESYCDKLNHLLLNDIGEKWDMHKDHYKKVYTDHATLTFIKLCDSLLQNKNIRYESIFEYLNW